MYVAFVVVVVFAYIVMSDGLFSMEYVGYDGKHYPVGIRFLSQVILFRVPTEMIINKVTRFCKTINE